MAITPITGTLGQSTPFSTVNDLIAQWPTAAQQQGVQLFGTAVDGYTTNYNDPTAISNLTLQTNPADGKGWQTYGNTYGIGVPSAYTGWFSDASKIRAEINYDPTTQKSQQLTVRFADNQTITEAFIDLEAFAAKTFNGQPLEKYGNEVGFLQAYKNGVLVPVTALRVNSATDTTGTNTNITSNAQGVTFTADSANPLDNTDYKFKIFGNFDKLVFSAKPYANPDPNIPTYNGAPIDSSDYLVQQITYKGIQDTPTPAKPVVFVDALDPVAGEGGLPEGTGTFQFSRTGGDINQPLTIRYTITGTATPGADYTALPGTVTIAAGQSVSAPVTVTPIDDINFEPTESVIVKIAEDLPYQVGSTDTASVGIRDNDVLSGTPQSPAGPVLRYNSNGLFVTTYNDITTAVNAASANDIIVITPKVDPITGLPTKYTETGSFAGSILIDKPLTLRGPNAGVSPTSSSLATPAVVESATAGAPVFRISANASNVTIEGLTVNMNGGNGVALQGDTSNVVIRQNNFTGLGPINNGVVYLDTGNAATLASASVIDNLIRDVSSPAGSVASGIQVLRFNTVRLTDNQIANVNGPGIAADAITNPLSMIDTNNITVTGQQGIQLAGGSAYIENNDITNTNNTLAPDRAGIRLRNSGVTSAGLQQVNVRSNVITNSYNAVAIANPASIATPVATDGVKINYNNFIGSINSALYDGGTGTLDATNNWWDDVTGPVVGGTGKNAIILANTGTVTSSPFSTTVF